MRKTKGFLGRVLMGALLLNLLWYLAALLLNTPVLVNPLTVYSQIGTVWQQSMSAHLLASLLRIVIGISIALVLGFMVALSMFRYKNFGRVMDSFVYFCYPIPKLALLPIIMLLAGLGDVTKIIMIVLIIIFQIIVNLRDSLRNISKESFLVLTSLGATHAQLMRHLILPAITPEALSTLRVAIGTAISVLFVTETYGTNKGMGFFIVDAWMRISYTEMYVGIVVLGMAGFFLFLLVDGLETALCRWRNS